jgi:hypothetical protein
MAARRDGPGALSVNKAQSKALERSALGNWCKVGTDLAYHDCSNVFSLGDAVRVCWCPLVRSGATGVLWLALARSGALWCALVRSGAPPLRFSTTNWAY